jgi:hypothetical protein
LSVLGWRRAIGLLPLTVLLVLAIGLTRGRSILLRRVEEVSCLRVW